MNHRISTYLKVKELLGAQLATSGVIHNNIIMQHDCIPTSYQFLTILCIVDLHLEINPCDSSPCANTGNCTSLGPFNYRCECAAGYTGSTCEVDIDECLMAVCPANSSCVDAVNSYMCVCNPGFKGDQCTSVIMPLEGQLEGKLK